MSDLYQARSWTLDVLTPPRTYVFRSGDAVLADVPRVPIERPGEASMPYPNPHLYYDETRVLVCVAAPDGKPYFYIDRMTNGMAMVVAPDGALIGTIKPYIGGLKGSFSVVTMNSNAARFALQDAQYQRIGLLHVPLRANWEDTGAGSVTDASDADIARFEMAPSPLDERRRRYTTDIHGPLSEPLHTLLLASLVSSELLTFSYV